MSFEDLLNRYKNMAMWPKLILLFTLGAFYPIYSFLDVHQNLSADFQQAKMEKDAADTKLRAARDKKKRLPELEEKVDIIERELAKASKKLPNDLAIDQILEKTAMLAEDVGVALNQFEPGNGAISDTAFRYLEIPIQISLTGAFDRVVTFMDRIVHLETLIHLRNFDFIPTIKKSDLPETYIKKDKKDDFRDVDNEVSIQKRKRIRVAVTGEIVVYRSLSDDEVKKLGSDNKDNKKEAPGGAGSQGAPAATSNLPADKPKP